MSMEICVRCGIYSRILHLTNVTAIFILVISSAVLLNDVSERATDRARTDSDQDLLFSYWLNFVALVRKIE